MEKLANISTFESLMNGSGGSIWNGFFGRIKTGAANLASQARFSMGKWGEHRQSNRDVKGDILKGGRNVADPMQTMVARELLSYDPSFLDYVDKLCLAGNQVNKYAKLWLLGKRSIDMTTLEGLIDQIQSNAAIASSILGRSCRRAQMSIYR